MTDSEIGRILREKNPWWTDAAKWRFDDRQLRLLKQSKLNYTPRPLAGLVAGGLYTLLGPRRVGKSAELRRAIVETLDSGIEPRRLIYCSCDGFRAQDLRRMFVVGRNLTPTVDEPRIWFVDEVTAVPDWSSVIKDARDDSPVGDELVVLTGSSARGFAEATKNLADRRGGAVRSDRLLLPMGFRSFCEQIGVTGLPDIDPVEPRDAMTSVAGDAFDELSYHLGDLEAAWEAFLRVGGFPRAVDDFVRHGAVQADFVNGLWDVIRGEVLRATSLSDAETATFLSRIAEGINSPVNLSALARDVGLGSHHTARERIADLVRAFELWACHQVSANKNPALDRPNTAAMSKIYFHDPLLTRLAHERDSRFPEPDASRISEQQLGIALVQALDRHDPDVPSGFIEATSVMYERTANKEIDFVGPKLEVGFEGKYVDKGWKQEALTLKNSPRHGHGLLATRGVYDRSNAVWAIPASMLVWFLA